MDAMEIVGRKFHITWIGPRTKWCGALFLVEICSSHKKEICYLYWKCQEIYSSQRKAKIAGVGFPPRMMCSWWPPLPGTFRASLHLLDSWTSCGNLRFCQECLIFGWLVLRGCILSMDNLRRRNMIIINACPLCLSGEESVDHVLMNCLMAHQVWTSISAGLSAVGLLLRALVIPLRVFFW